MTGTTVMEKGHHLLNTFCFKPLYIKTFEKAKIKSQPLCDPLLKYYRRIIYVKCSGITDSFGSKLTAAIETLLYML